MSAGERHRDLYAVHLARDSVGCWLVAAWLAVFGMWPFADPGHDDLRDVVVWLDFGLHWFGVTAIYLMSPYRLVRVREDSDEQ